MPISTLRAIGRKRVAWLRATPPEPVITIFKERQYVAGVCTASDLKDPIYLSGIAAVIFTQNIDKPFQIINDLKEHAQVLLDYDCRLIVRPASSEQALATLKKGIENLEIPIAGLPIGNSGTPPFPHAHVFSDSTTWNAIADFILMHPSGPSPSQTLKIEPEKICTSLSESKKLLLRRSFANCSEVYLIPMDEGNSGVNVYRAYAELSEGLEGQWPLPHFVKIGNRKKIFDEYEIYEGRVDPYVPFHLGPHLIRERCCLGAYEGILVGDFVEESESLTDCASEGRAAPAIACLFDRTLFGWHRESEEDTRSISQLLEKYFPERKDISKERFARAKMLGATKDLAKLRVLFERCNTTPVRVGPIHGDLHANNVLVRANDAIVIDFLAYQKNPLLFDAASLEASLIVEGFVKDKRPPEEWLRSIEPLYSRSPLKGEGVIPHINPKNPSLWFYNCVRLIRQYARHWECKPFQYAGALAVALLRKAGKDNDAVDPEASCRAVAYVLAERVLIETFDKKATPTKQAGNI